MTIRRVVLALLLALLALGTTGPLPAFAGGMSSVLITTPTGQRAGSVYYDDLAVVADLHHAVGYESQGALEQPAALGGDGSSEVLLIWIAHGRTIGQLERVLLTQDDGIWIQTIPTWYSRDATPTDQLGRWRRPADATSLTAVLTRAGMLGDGAPTRSTPTTGAPSTSAIPPLGAAPAAGEVGAAPGLPMFAVAALAGLAGLVLGGAVTGVWAARRRAEAPEVVNPAGRGGVPPA